MILKRTIALIIILVLLISSVAYFTLAYIIVAPKGIWLQSQITITFSDGTKINIASENKNLLTNTLQKLSVITSQGKKIISISVNTYVKYGVTPSDRELTLQDWFQYYISISGTYANGLREYDPLTGFTDLFHKSYQDTQQTSRWILIYNNPGASWTGITDFVKYFYKEAGTGLQAGLLNIGPELAKEIVDATSGAPIASTLASKLTSILGTQKYGDGDTEYIIQWSMPGWDFYTNLKRMDWQGLAIHIGSFTIGAGKWLRMHDGDQYTITFKLAYFLRYKDVTGEWTEWKAGTVELGTLTLTVQQGTWYLLDLNINGGVNIQT